jgi:hypothetical protein
MRCAKNIKCLNIFEVPNQTSCNRTAAIIIPVVDTLLEFVHGFNMIYLLTAIGLTPGGSSTVHIYTHTVHRITQLTARTVQLTT